MVFFSGTWGTALFDLFFQNYSIPSNVIGNFKNNNQLTDDEFANIVAVILEAEGFNVIESRQGSIRAERIVLKRPASSVRVVTSPVQTIKRILLWSPKKQ